MLRNFLSLLPAGAIALLIFSSSAFAGSFYDPQIESFVEIHQTAGNWIKKLRFQIQDPEGDFEVRQVSMTELQFFETKGEPSFKAIKKVNSPEIHLYDQGRNLVATLIEIKDTATYLSYKDEFKNELYRGSAEIGNEGLLYRFREYPDSNLSEDILVMRGFGQNLSHHFSLERLKKHSMNEKLLIARAVFDAIRSYRRQNIVGASLLTGLTVAGGFKMLRSGSTSSKPQTINLSSESATGIGSLANETSSGNHTQPAAPLSPQNRPSPLRPQHQERFAPTIPLSDNQPVSKEQKLEEKKEQEEDQPKPISLSLKDKLKQMNLTVNVSSKFNGKKVAGVIKSIAQDGKIGFQPNENPFVTGNAFRFTRNVPGLNPVQWVKKEDVTPEVPLSQFKLTPTIAYMDRGAPRLADIKHAYADHTVEIEGTDLFNQPITIFLDIKDVETEIVPPTQKTVRTQHPLLGTFSDQVAREFTHGIFFTPGNQKGIPSSSVLVDFSDLGLTQFVSVDDNGERKVGRITRAFRDGHLTVEISDYSIPPRSITAQASEVKNEIFIEANKKARFTNRLGVQTVGTILHEFTDGLLQIMTSIHEVVFLPKDQVVAQVSRESLNLSSNVLFFENQRFHIGIVKNAFEDGLVEVAISDEYGKRVIKSKMLAELSSERKFTEQKTVAVGGPDGTISVGTVKLGFSNGVSQVQLSDGSTHFYLPEELKYSTSVQSLGLTDHVSFFDRSGTPQSGKIIQAFDHKQVQVSGMDQNGKAVYSVLPSDHLSSEVEISVTPHVFFTDSNGRSLSGEIQREFSYGILEVKTVQGIKVVMRHEVSQEIENHPRISEFVSVPSDYALFGQVIRAFANGRFEVLVQYLNNRFVTEFFTADQMRAEVVPTVTEVPFFYDLYGEQQSGTVVREFSNGKLVIRDANGNLGAYVKNEILNQVKPEDLSLTETVAFLNDGDLVVGTINRAQRDGKLLIVDDLSATYERQAAEVHAEVPLETYGMTDVLITLADRTRFATKVLKAFDGNILQVKGPFGAFNQATFLVVRTTDVAKKVSLESLGLKEYVLVPNDNSFPSILRVEAAYSDGSLLLHKRGDRLKPGLWKHKDNLIKEIPVEERYQRETSFKIPNESSEILSGTVKSQFAGGYFWIEYLKSGRRFRVIIKTEHLCEKAPEKLASVRDQLEIGTEIRPEVADEKETSETLKLKKEYRMFMAVGEYLNKEIIAVGRKLKLDKTISDRDLTNRQVDLIITEVARLITPAEGQKKLKAMTDHLTDVNRKILARQIRLTFHPDKPQPLNKSLGNKIFTFLDPLVKKFLN